MNDLPATENPDRVQRLELLRVRAQQVMDEYHDFMPSAGGAGGLSRDAIEGSKLLEELRIYQVELEVQNEELRRAQQDADLARSRYQALFGQMPMPALVLDAKGLVQRSNQRADELLGPPRRMVTLDNRLFQKLSPADRARLHRAIHDLIHGEPHILGNVRLPSGEDVGWYDVHLIKLSNTYHLDSHVLALLLDRTSERARAQEQHFFNAFLDSSEDFFYAADNDGRMVMANKALLDFLGRSRDEVVGHPREDFLSVHDAIVHRESDQRVLKYGASVTLEERLHQMGNSAPVEFLTRKFPLHNLEGVVTGVGGLSTNVTASNEQKRQADLSESVFMAAAEAILITDTETRIIRVNPAFVRLTGFSEGTVVGHKAGILKSGRHDKAFYDAMWMALTETGHWAGEMSDRTADGRHYTIWNSINAIRDTQGQTLYYVAVQTDLTPLREAQSKIQILASYDSLTGLPNRALFADRLKQLLAQAHRHSRTFAVMFMDLDHFKQVNDSLGHHVGDELLIGVAQRLTGALRSEDTVARLGGDEFVVLMPSIDRAAALATANKLLKLVHSPMQVGSMVNYQPMASLGIAVFPQDGETTELLLRNADTAMYAAKAAGRNRAAAYTEQMSAVSARAFAIQTELTAGIGRGELRLFYQPKYHLKTGVLVGAEALVRWERPGVGLVQPVDFIPIAERTGLIVELDRWVLRESVSQIAQWRASGTWTHGMRLAVNQSAADLCRQGMVEELLALLQEFAVGPSALEMEITEGALMENTQEIIESLEELKQLGIVLTIDDFGTGFSSLAYLRKLPISVIKIDRGFVDDMLTNENDRVLVETIISMAHNLGRTLVAEGVETQAQRVRLTELNCEVAQGYLFGRPVPPAEFAAKFLAASGPPT